MTKCTLPKHNLKQDRICYGPGHLTRFQSLTSLTIQWVARMRKFPISTERAKRVSTVECCRLWRARLCLAFCDHFQFNNKVFHPNSTIFCWKVLILQATLFCCTKWRIGRIGFFIGQISYISLYSIDEFIGRGVDCLWSICILRMCWGWWTIFFCR